MLEPDQIQRVIEDFFTRCERHRRIGIPLRDVIDRTAIVPAGWYYDHETAYFLPQSASFEKH